MNLDTGAFRNNEIEFLGTGEISDAGMRDVGRLVRRHHVIPRTHVSSEFGSLEILRLQ